jgi:Predicted membrane protein
MKESLWSPQVLYKFVILLLVIISLVTRNKNLGAASLIIFVISLTNSQKAIDFIEKYFMDLGMIFLMMWMLIPLIKKSYLGLSTFKSLLTINGAVSFIMGALVVVLASRGVSFTQGNADVLTGVVLGSIVGVSFLGGVPVGPLIASGIAYEVVKIINHILGNK